MPTSLLQQQQQQGLVLATGFGLAKLLLLKSWHIWLEFLLLGLWVLPGRKQYNDQQ
jgi:hypothetical protein